jgi:hypothetical protein
MGALPRGKAGIGSAMNDVVRELGGTLGVAVLGSILTSSYGRGMDDAIAGLPPAAAEAASDSVGAAHEVAARLGGGAGAHFVDTANNAFVHAMATTATLAPAAAVIGALIALVFLPSRARDATARTRHRARAGRSVGARPLWPGRSSPPGPGGRHVVHAEPMLDRSGGASPSASRKQCPTVTRRGSRRRWHAPAPRGRTGRPR